VCVGGVVTCGWLLAVSFFLRRGGWDGHIMWLGLLCLSKMRRMGGDAGEQAMAVSVTVAVEVTGKSSERHCGGGGRMLQISYVHS
jgi:hypothetical protein